MRTMILTMLTAAAFVILPANASAQDQSMMQNDEMTGMMGGEGTGGMGMMDMDRGMMGGGCGMHGSGMGMGMMDGHGKGGMMGLGPIGMLDLNADQRTRLNKIQLDLRKQLWALKGKTFDSRAQLEQLYDADRLDSKKIGSVYSQLFDVRRQMIEAQIEAKNRAKEILTKEQIDKLKQIQQHHGGMMGAGEMHGRSK